MILLDTNYLIGLLVPGSEEAARIRTWYKNEQLCTSSIAWHEFLCGPVTAEAIALVQALLEDRILPFDADHSRESARLFNAAGRPRRLRVDSMIAAAAILHDARLATANVADFSVFARFGLTLEGTDRTESGVAGP